jgi:xanthine dehydrogenase accessory factor
MSMNRFERGQLRSHIVDAIQRFGSVVLATLVQKHGPFYRAVGFQCGINAEGIVRPFLAGPCTERLVAALSTASAATFPQVISIDSGSLEDQLMGTGSGCGGRVELLCEALTADDLPRLDHWIGQRDQLHTEDVQWSIRKEHDGVAARRVAEHHQAPGFGSDSGASQIQWRRHADPRLWVIGGADDALPVVRLAHLMGWWVGLIDHRALPAASLKPMVQQWIQTRPNRDVVSQILRGDFILIMSHNLQIDQGWLANLAGSEAEWLAVLGPAQRTELIVAQLAPSQQQGLRGRLHARVGLPFKSRAPEILAAGIMAELQTVWENSLT